MNITPKAIYVLKQMLLESNQSPIGFVIELTPGHFTPQIHFSLTDHPIENHKVVSFEGLAFYMDANTASEVSGYTIDHNQIGFKLELQFPQGRCCK